MSTTVTTAPAAPIVQLDTSSWTDRALAVVSTASLALGGAIVMLMLLATPGQPLDALFQTSTCGLAG